MWWHDHAAPGFQCKPITDASAANGGRHRPGVNQLIRFQRVNRATASDIGKVVTVINLSIYAIIVKVNFRIAYFLKHFLDNEQFFATLGPRLGKEPQTGTLSHLQRIVSGTSQLGNASYGYAVLSYYAPNGASLEAGGYDGIQY